MENRVRATTRPSPSPERVAFHLPDGTNVRGTCGAAATRFAGNVPNKRGTRAQRSSGSPDKTSAVTVGRYGGCGVTGERWTCAQHQLPAPCRTRTRTSCAAQATVTRARTCTPRDARSLARSLPDSDDSTPPPIPSWRDRVQCEFSFQRTIERPKANWDDAYGFFVETRAVHDCALALAFYVGKSLSLSLSIYFFFQSFRFHFYLPLPLVPSYPEK